MYKHVIWDFDGTLFDTYPIIIQNLDNALREFGYTCDPLEAMKLMNEIQAEADGVITAVLANNGELVEYDQPLFGIQ